MLPVGDHAQDAHPTSTSHVDYSPSRTSYRKLVGLFRRPRRERVRDCIGTWSGLCTLADEAV